MTLGFGGRDGDEYAVMTTDRYLDALLGAHVLGSPQTPASSTLDLAARAAADRLSRELPRLHPSFRFEEALWLRLSDVAHGMRLEAAAGSGGAPIAVLRAGRGGTELDDLAALVEGPDPERDATNSVRPLLVGGALTSAALSLAGAAYVAWRRSRPRLA